MAVIETWLDQDLQKPVQVKHLDGNLFSNNGNGNRIGVAVYNNGEPVTLTGTVSGYAIVADGSTVPCTGARSGNKASILIPPAAYLPGAIFISIFLTDGTTVTTLAAIASTVMQTRTNNQVSPGSVVQDWTQTINAAMQSVEDAAENLGGIIATPYASLTYPVPLGKYTYYNNGLYRCISPIAASEEFTAAHWTQVKLGDDVSDLKSALNEQAHEDILDNEYIYGVPFHSYEKTIEPNTGTQMLYNVQGISCSQFVNRFTDYDFSGGGLTMKINYSDETETTIGFGENTNNYIFYAGNHGSITGVRVYSNTNGLTANVYVKGVVLFGKEGNDLKSIINTINKNIAGLQTKLFQTGVSRSDTVKDFTDFGESWNIDIAITAPHRIAYCQTVFRLASEKITGINSIRVKGTIIPLTDNIDNIRIFDADQFANYTYNGNYEDIPVDGVTSFDETVALTGLESATINVGISVGSSHTTEYNTNWQYLLHGLEVYVNGQRVYGQELTFTGMIGFDSNTYTLNNSAYYNKEIATLPLNRSDISDAIKDQSYINIQAAVTQPDRVAYLQNLFSLTIPQYESIEKIRVKGIFVPKTENINIVRFYQADQMNTTAGGASTGKFLPTGEYAEIKVNTLQETEIDETIYPSGLSDNLESVVFAVARNATTAYNTAWTWDFNNLQIFINDKLLPIDSIVFRGYIGFSGYTPDIERINVPDIITREDLQDYMPKFAGVPAPNVLPIGKNFATGTLAVERSADTSAFDAGYCESPVVWWDSNRLKYGMVYTGYSIGTGSSQYGFGQVGLAWSDDLVNWEKDENAPILSPSHVEGDPDRGSITGPVMLLRDGVYYLYYIGCSEEGYEMGTKTLCLATGTDIYNLTKFEHNPIIAPQPTDTTSPYRHNIYHANIVFGTDKYYMFINCSGVRPTDQHACENILLFTSDDLYNWNYDSVVLEGGTATTDPDYAICGDPCVFDIGDDNLYMTIFRVTLNGVGTGTGLARTSKKDFPYGWKKYDFRFGSGIKAYVTFRGNTMYHFYNENRQIYVQTSN